MAIYRGIAAHSLTICFVRISTYLSIKFFPTSVFGVDFLSDCAIFLILIIAFLYLYIYIKKSYHFRCFQFSAKTMVSLVARYASFVHTEC